MECAVLYMYHLLSDQGHDSCSNLRRLSSVSELVPASLLARDSIGAALRFDAIVTDEMSVFADNGGNDGSAAADEEFAVDEDDGAVDAAEDEDDESPVSSIKKERSSLALISPAEAILKPPE
jgi:hypothetical protein